MLNIPYNYDVRHIMTNKSDFFSHIIHTGGKTFGDEPSRHYFGDHHHPLWMRSVKF